MIVSAAHKIDPTMWKGKFALEYQPVDTIPCINCMLIVLELGCTDSSVIFNIRLKTRTLGRKLNVDFNAVFYSKQK